MGRKVHPVGFRLKSYRDWNARWYAEGNRYRNLLAEDFMLRDKIKELMPRAGISMIEIERFPNQVQVTIHTAKPGIVIGRKGANVNSLRRKLEELTSKKVHVDIQEIENPDIDAYLVAESIAQQLERRISHRRAMKQAIRRAMRAGAEGIMIACGGRLSGSEMARREKQREGRVPRHTLRADIDYGRAESLTTFGRIGVKVWIYKGEVLPEASEEEALAY